MSDKEVTPEQQAKFESILKQNNIETVSPELANSKDISAEKTGQLTPNIPPEEQATWEGFIEGADATPPKINAWEQGQQLDVEANHPETAPSEYEPTPDDLAEFGQWSDQQAAARLEPNSKLEAAFEKHQEPYSQEAEAMFKDAEPVNDHQTPQPELEPDR